jgi:hypothetical protein
MTMKVHLLLALTILVAITCAVSGYYIRTTGPNWDDTWRVKAAQISPSEYETEKSYIYAIDHPALGRYVYRTVAMVLGVPHVDVPDVDYSKTERWNIDAGRLPPTDVVYVLRYVNGAFFLAAVVLLFAAAFLVLRNAWLALATALPFAVSEHIQVGVVAYVGSDVMLAFFLALAILLWTRFTMKGREKSVAAVLSVSLVCGLAVSAKLNGGLLVIAYLAYLAIISRGAGRVVRPAAATLVMCAVFVAFNPILRGGGPGWALHIIREMLAMRREIWLDQFGEAPVGRMGLVAKFFPYAAFAPLLAAAFLALRKERWTLPVVCWAAVLVVGTLASAHRTYRRYFLPVEIAVFFSSGLAAWRLVQISIAERRERGGARGEAKGRAWRKRAAMGAGVAAVVGVALVTMLAAWAPWGPGRIRGAVSPAEKTAHFYRQALAYYGVAEPAEQEAAGPRLRSPRPLGTAATRQMLATILILASCAMVIEIAGAALGSGWWGLGLVAVFLWMEWTGFTLRTHSVSDGLLALFAVLQLRLWVKREAGVSCEDEGPENLGTGTHIGQTTDMCTSPRVWSSGGEGAVRGTGKTWGQAQTAETSRQFTPVPVFPSCGGEGRKDLGTVTHIGDGTDMRNSPRVSSMGDWRFVAWAAVLAAGAAAAAPEGIAVAAATVAYLLLSARREEKWVAQREARRPGVFARNTVARAAVAAIAVLALYPALEAVFWWLGARASIDFAQGIWAGGVRHWSARWGETINFLIPVQELYPWWMLLPLAAAGLYAVRRERWVGAVAVWAGAILLGNLVLRETNELKASAVLNWAMVLGAGMASCALLKGAVWGRARVADDTAGASGKVGRWESAKEAEGEARR